MSLAAPQRWWQRLRALFTPPGPVDPGLDLPPDFLQLLERLRLLSIRAVGGGVRQGHRLGAYRGGQLEFHDYRAYTPGDDLRYLDWNLYARMEKAFIKEFAREEAGAVHILLDGTPSMSLGTPSKWTFARRLAALLAHVAWTGQDIVQVSIFRSPQQPLSTFPPNGNKGNTAQLLDWLRRERLGTLDRSQDISQVRSAEALSDGVRQFLSSTASKGRAFLLSDFWDGEETLTAAFHRLTASGFELSAVHVLSPEELAPPDAGDWRLFADEEAGDVELAVTRPVLERYASELEAYRAAVEGLVRRRGGMYLFAPSNTSLERVLIHALRRRLWVA